MCFNRMNTTKSLTVLAFALLMTLPVAAQRPGFGGDSGGRGGFSGRGGDSGGRGDSVVVVEILAVVADSAAAGEILADVVGLGAEAASIPVPF